MTADNGKDQGGDRYREAGVRLEAAEDVVVRIRKLVDKRASQAESLSAIGGFAGAYALESGPTLLAGADGVGTKVLVARAMGDARTIGLDLVAMNVNDIVAAGGRPLFFLDYIAAAQLDGDLLETLIAGMLDGCEQAGCRLLGGETAEMPGLYRPDDYDLAGFAVGLRVFEPRAGRVGDAIVGILAEGFHANGFSLVRKIVETKGLDYHCAYAAIDHRVLGEALLAPTPIYVPAVLDVLNAVGPHVRGLAHITGGGIIDNVPRALGDPALGVELERAAWRLPRLLTWFQELGELSAEEMAHTFNGGLGFALVVDPEASEAVVGTLARWGLCGVRVGTVVDRSGVHWR